MKIVNSLALAALVAVSVPAGASVTLYNQNFENPVGFVNNGSDLSQQNVNDLYPNQPPGFVFSQTNTVETLHIGGSLAFGHGYSDPAAIGGSYALGMLSTVQDDLLGLAFNVGSFDFLNLGIDISSIDLSCCGGPFVPTGSAASIPIFRFSLFDNPSGASGVGSGLTLLDSFDATGLQNPSKDSFLWSAVTGGLDASGSTNGNVILQIDLLQGGYASFDNIRVVASDIRGDLGGVPEPATWAMMLLGFAAMGVRMRSGRHAEARLALTA